MKLIASTDDTSYFERRAQILIEEARAIRMTDGSDTLYQEKIIKAVQLLALAALT